MAELLVRKGDFRILSDDVGKLGPNGMNELVKEAATTCYQSRKTSKKTPADFVKFLRRNKHFSMLEHSWFTFLVKMADKSDFYKVGYSLLASNSLFCLTERENAFVISGNARVFNEAYLKTKNKIVGNMLYALNKENPVIFPYSPKYEHLSAISIERGPEMISKDEVIVHRAVAVEFNNVSRGFTHEDVRSRGGDQKIASYAQESTRYVDYFKGELNVDMFQIKFVPNYTGPQEFNREIEVLLSNGKLYHWTPRQMAEIEEAFYRALRKNGWKPEEARQWLPIGIKSQIVQTYNLNEWQHWFYLRTSLAAHPEIRAVALKLLKEFQKRMPGLFDDFECRQRKDGTGYAVYKGNSSLI